MQPLRRYSQASNVLEWSAPPAALALGHGQVHVWRASLDRLGSRAEELQSLLDADERERATRFRFEQDRLRFIVARGVLRMLLGRYLARHPSELTFVYSPLGKPSLPPDLRARLLRFNLSHSNEFALFAFTFEGEVGIDIEQLCADFPEEEIAERFFSSGEVAALGALAPALKTEGFFNCWTRKEAYIKAVGDGLSHQLEHFSVSLAPDEPAALIASADPLELSRWSFRELTPAPGYVAALVVEGRDLELQCYDLLADQSF